MALHTSLGRRRVFTLLRTSAFVRFHLRSQFSAFPKRGRLTALGSGEHEAPPLTREQPLIFPDSRGTSRDSEVDLVCAPAIGRANSERATNAMVPAPVILG